MNWIKVEDRLPETSSECVVKYYHGTTRKAIFKDNCFYDNETFSSSAKLKFNNIKYWMLLPEPPKN